MSGLRERLTNKTALRTLGFGVLLIAAALGGYYYQIYASHRADREFKNALALLVTGGDQGVAKDEFLDVLRQRPDAVEPRYDLGLIAEAHENWTEALKWFADVIARAPSESRIAKLAKLHMHHCKLAAAQDATPGGKLLREYGEALARARLFARSGLGEPALVEADKAEKLDPRGWEAHVIAAEALALGQQYRSAAAELKAALAFAPAEKQEALQNAVALNDRFAAAHVQAQNVAMEASNVAKKGNFLMAAHLYQVAWLTQHQPIFEFKAAESLIAAGKTAEGRVLLVDVTRRYAGPVAENARTLLLKFHSARN